MNYLLVIRNEVPKNHLIDQVAELRCFRRDMRYDFLRKIDKLHIYGVIRVNTLVVVDFGQKQISNLPSVRRRYHRLSDKALQP